MKQTYLAVLIGIAFSACGDQSQGGKLTPIGNTGQSPKVDAGMSPNAIPSDCALNGTNCDAVSNQSPQRGSATLNENLPLNNEVEKTIALANAGDAQAQYQIGQRYDVGSGVSLDSKQACQWYLKAANQGHLESQHATGACYDRGDYGAADPEEAAKWYKKAANKGYALSQDALGIISYFRKDFKQAAEWLTAAANSGLATAQYNLGLLYANGEGVSQDKTQALKWWMLAAAQGHTQAATSEFKIAQELNPEELNRARQLFNEFNKSRPQR